MAPEVSWIGYGPGFVIARARGMVLLGLGSNKFVVLEKINNLIGLIVKVDSHTMSQSKGKVARICVELDISKPLTLFIEVEGRTYEVVYKGIQVICFEGASKVKCASTIKDFKKVYAIDGFTVLGPRSSSLKVIAHASQSITALVYVRISVGDYNLTSQQFPRLVEVNLDGLSSDVSNEEIHQSLFSISGLKSLWPDGFPTIFYQNFWDICSNDIIMLIQNYFQMAFLLENLNETFIALIPKFDALGVLYGFKALVYGIQWRIGSEDDVLD
ncbi:hypothetical protein SADUNF_Sadunf16G0072200 [Salix dunnii]|uniref:Uncharacterized protein n=1 Tax=Salix dunnii TaxID=1413687 RepID=A0A835MG96_9ROSI|nr:hypothetical protein SADUNF_Sadunf16G0072200 [Salix dunnii]